MTKLEVIDDTNFRKFLVEKYNITVEDLHTIYLQTKKANSAKEIYNFLKKYHKRNHFIKMAKFNSNITTGDVINTNNCIISVCKTRKKNMIIVISAIDNLIKGASGQAIQNMNAAYNFKENMGLK